ncbi:hypothetical protein LCGC14_1313190 [marine sediment metagenome]|uniref:Uncharacterized protein n=1 Tax=marine sediment metagenome TaxID=412755 RepID=A0A0F9L6V2_9ZZZZ
MHQPNLNTGEYPPTWDNRVMTTGEAWFVTIVLALILVLGMGAVEVLSSALTGG